VYDMMSNGVVSQESKEWQHLEEVLREVHGGNIYRCRHHVEGGRGGSRGVVIG